MIGAIAALMLNGASVLPATDLAATDLPQFFEAACLDGEAKLSPGAASAIAFDALPGDIRESLGKPSSAKVWRLSGSGRAYLYLLDYQGPDESPRICGLASDQMNYTSAADAVEKRVTGEVHPRTMRTTEWINPKGGYSALATTSGEFKVLQVNWLSDSQRQQLIKIQAAIP